MHFGEPPCYNLPMFRYSLGTNSTTFSRRWQAPATVIAFLLIATLACQLNAGGPEAPAAPIPPSEDSAESLLEEWESAIRSAAETGQIELAISESQISSLVSERLAELPDPVLKDTSVFLRDGKIQIYGISEQDYVRANVLVEVTPMVDPDGMLSLEVSEAQFGPFPAPDSLKNSISSLITEAFTGGIGPLATGIRVQSVSVDDGVMIILAEVR